MSPLASRRLFFYLLTLPLWSAALLLILTGVLVITLRAVFYFSHTWQDELLDELNQRVAGELQIDHWQFSLEQLNPRLHLQNLLWTTPDGHTVFALEELTLVLDTWQSLVTLTPQLKKAQIRGVDFYLDESAEGWQGRFQQVAPSPDVSEADRLAEVSAQAQQWLDWLLRQGELDLQQLHLHLQPLDHPPQTLVARSLHYQSWSGGRELEFMLDLPQAQGVQPRLVLTFFGDAFSGRPDVFEAYLWLPQLDFAAWQALWPPAWPQPPAAQRADALEAWLQYDRGNWRLQLQLDGVAITAPDGVSLSVAQAALEWQRSDVIQRLDWVLEDGLLDGAALDWRGSIQLDAEQALLRMEAIDLSLITPFLDHFALMPTALDPLLKDLALEGRLEQLVWQAPRDQLSAWRLSAALDQVGVAAWAGAPEAQGVIGQLWLQPDRGWVDLQGAPLHFGFPQFYTRTWPVDAAWGRVAWQQQETGWLVLGQPLEVHLAAEEGLDATQVRGEFALLIPEEGEPHFYLNLGLAEAQAAQYARLVPGRLLPETLMNWLDASIQGGRVRQGAYLMSGHLGAGLPLTVQLALDVEAVALDFDPQWPQAEQLAGQIRWRDDYLAIDLPRGHLAGLDLSDVRIAGQVTEAGLRLDLQTHWQADLRYWPRWMHSTPLRQWVPSLLSSWDYHGVADGDFALQLDFAQSEVVTDLRLEAVIQQGQLVWPDLQIQLDAVQGDLVFDWHRGLSSSGLTAHWGEVPVDVHFGGQDPWQLRWTLDGLEPAMITEVLRRPPVVGVEGQTSVSGVLSWTPQQLSLALESDLLGWSWSGPASFSKASDLALPLALNIDFTQAPWRLDLALGEALALAAWLDAERPALHLAWGETAAAAENLDLAEGQFMISVAQPVLDLAPYWDWYQRLESDGLIRTEGTETTAWEYRLQAELGQLCYQQRCLQAVQLEGEQQADLWRVRWIATESEGEAYQLIRAQPWQLEIDYLHWPDHVADPDEPIEQAPGERRAALAAQPFEDPWAELGVLALPNIDLTLGDLRWGQRQLGQWQAQLRPLTSTQGWQVEAQGRLESSRLLGHVHWDRAREQTQFSFQLAGEDVAPALSALLAQPASVTSRQHDLSMTGHWAGSPAAFSLYALQAQLNVDLRQGRFPQVEGGAREASRLLALLNPVRLLRRLQLDFSDVTEQGFAYERVQGRYRLTEGRVTTESPLVMTSAVPRLTLRGEIDLIEQTLDQEMSLVLPVGQTLPLAAVLAGAPQVGLVLWLVQRSVGGLLDNLSQAHYRITGPLADPDIRLQSLF